jgi:acetylornithine deacetylase/succinyl-diaminopimelate desuccinylase-like protein
MSEGQNKKYDLEERTARFSEAIIKFAKKIPVNQVSGSIIVQFVKAGTSIGANYCEADDAESGKDKVVIEKGAKLMIDQRFSDVKSNKKALGKLAEYLTIYAEKSANAENFADCVTTLYEKADALLKADSDALADNI